MKNGQNLDKRRAEVVGAQRGEMRPLPAPIGERKRADHDMKLEGFLVQFACRSLGFTYIATIGLFYLQGFHVLGFSLDPMLMRWIGVSSVGVIGSATMIVYKAIFRRRFPAARSAKLPD